MTKRQRDRLNELLRMWAGEVGAATVQEQLPLMIREWVQKHMESLLSDGGDWGKELDPLREAIGEQANRVVQEMIGDPGWLRRTVKDHVESAISEALLTFSDSLSMLKCENCGADK